MLSRVPTETFLAKIVSRRGFGKAALATGMVTAGATLLRGAAVRADGITDVDILNFALNLEYLEAEFYTVVTTGQTIDQIGIGIDGVGTPGPTTGGAQVKLNGRLGDIAQEIAYDEQQHVVLLRSALGDAAIAKPAIDLNALAGVCNCNYDDPKDVLRLARAFEDVGVSAYGGAAPLISDKDILGTAARIALTEALHAGNVRLLVAEHRVDVVAVDDKDVLPPPAGAQYFPVDAQALAIVRSVSEVLAIVYGNSTPGTSSGGFFPNGVNGTIDTV